MKEYLFTRFIMGSASTLLVLAIYFLAKLLVDDLSSGWSVAAIIGSLVIVGGLLTVNGVALVEVMRHMRKKGLM